MRFTSTPYVTTAKGASALIALKAPRYSQKPRDSLSARIAGLRIRKERRIKTGRSLWVLFPLNFATFL